MKMIKNFLNDESGMETLEYAVIAGLIAAVAVLVYAAGWGTALQKDCWPPRQRAESPRVLWKMAGLREPATIPLASKQRNLFSSRSSSNFQAGRTDLSRIKAAMLAPPKIRIALLFIPLASRHHLHGCSLSAHSQQVGAATLIGGTNA